MTLGRARSARILIALLATAILTTLAGVTAATAVVDTSFSCPGTIEPAGFVDIGKQDATTRRAIDWLAIGEIALGWPQVWV